MLMDGAWNSGSNTREESRGDCKEDAQAGECELDAHGESDESHDAAAALLARFQQDGELDDKPHHGNAVTGTASREWTTARVITPVIVPGLAAKRISGLMLNPRTGKACL